jgi:hypothetical protein
MSHELNPFYPSTRDQNGNMHQAELAVDLLSIKTKQSYSFTVISRISGVEIRHDDGGQSSVNAGSVEQARNLSIKKSAKRIAKYCR